jgi:hypothetical protein
MAFACSYKEPCSALLYVTEGNGPGDKGLIIVQMMNFEDDSVSHKLAYRKKAGKTTTHKFCMMQYCPACGKDVSLGFDSPGEYRPLGETGKNKKEK